MSPLLSDRNSSRKYLRDISKIIKAYFFLYSVEDGAFQGSISILYPLQFIHNRSMSSLYNNLSFRGWSATLSRPNSVQSSRISQKHFHLKMENQSDYNKMPDYNCELFTSTMTLLSTLNFKFEFTWNSHTNRKELQET